MGIVTALVSPVLVVLMKNTIYAFGVGVLLILTSIILFIAAILYDTQNRKYNNDFRYTSSLVEEATVMRPLHMKFILISLGATIVLFPFVYFVVGLLAILTGWIPLYI